MSDKITLHGKTYVTHDLLTCGDYGGAGSVGVANIRTVLEQFEGRVEEWSYRNLRREAEGEPSHYLCSGTWEHDIPEDPCLHVVGAYGSEFIYLLEGEEADEILAGLENYVVLDDEAVTEVEMEWEHEAWDSWLRSDLIHALYDKWDDEDLEGIDPEDLKDSVLWEAYQRAMEKTNTYPEVEYSGVHVDVDRIADTFCDILVELRIQENEEARRRAAEEAGQMELQL